MGQGVPYFSSVGNSGRESYEGAFAPGPMFDEWGIAHDFGAGDIYQKITIPEGRQAMLSFQWDSPFFSVSGGDGSANDLDIFILNEPPTTVLAGSTDDNIGGDPAEAFGYSNPADSGATVFNLVITKYDGPAPGLMKYILFGGGTISEFDTASGTVWGHANAAGAETVGTAFYADTPAFGVSPPLLEDFSSAGPTPILFEVDGTPTTEYRQKPEIVAPDGNNTTFFGSPDPEPDGFPNFYGTSAAAPHAAAVAALLLEADPSLTPAYLYDVLESTAADMGTPGFDFDSGFGLIRAPMAVAAVAQLPAADLSLTKADSPDPVSTGEKLTYTITVTNNGPSDATGVALTDELPTAAPHISATTTQGACDESNDTVTCDLGTLPNGGAATVTIVVSAPAPGTLSNTAAVEANEIDPDTSNNSAVETTQSNPPPSPTPVPSVSALGLMIMATLALAEFGRRSRLQPRREE